MFKQLGVESKNDLLGKSDFDFFDEDYAKEIAKDEKQIMNTGKALLNKVNKGTNRDGKITYLATSKLPLRDESGKIVGTFGISRDITESRYMEEELAKEKMLLDALLENLPASIYFKDKESRFIRISRSMLGLFQVQSFGEVIGKSDADFFGKAHSQKAFDDEQKIIQTGKPIINLIEKEVFDDGRVNYVSTTKMPLTDKDGNSIGTFGVSTNVTELKLLEERVEKQKKEIENISNAKKELEKLEKTKAELKSIQGGKK
jgi:PAS domain S-box-containing protein